MRIVEFLKFNLTDLLPNDNVLPAVSKQKC